MNLHKLLTQREADGRPIRVGLIGAGRYGTMYLAQANNIPGIHVVAIADINVKRAEGAFELVGWPKDQIAPDIATALRDRSTAIVANADELFDVDIDVIVEATGNPIVGVNHALRAIETEKHIIMVTVEADALAGPALAKRAEAAGVVYSMAYGDQPALIMELVDWARTCGFDVVCAGKGAKYLEHYHEMNPDNVWENWEFSKELTDSGQLNPYMHTSFRDGTKAAIEMAAVANAAGLVPSDDGLTFTPGDVEEIATICRPADVGGALAHEGTVDVMSSVTRDGDLDPPQHPGRRFRRRQGHQRIRLRLLQRIPLAPGPHRPVRRPVPPLPLRRPGAERINRQRRPPRDPHGFARSGSSAMSSPPPRKTSSR